MKKLQLVIREQSIKTYDKLESVKYSAKVLTH
jgi:hypothetical protein